MIIIHGMNASAILPRLLAPRVEKALRVSPVVVITGARQTGKSTLARAVEPKGDRLYVTLDDLDVRGDALANPHDLLRRAPRLTLDEVQHVPGLLSAVKRMVDERKVAGQFLLTGSANLLLMRRVAESLAGRAAYFTLWPMTRREQLGLGTAGIWETLLQAPIDKWLALVQAQETGPEDWRAAVRRGGYPTPALELEDDTAREQWFTGYAATYLERDVLQLAAIQALVEFRRLMRATCLRLGNLVNQTELGRDVGLPQPTVHRYLAMLEASYQLVRLPAYAVNRTKRLIKTPKLYWSDPGMALYLAAEPTPRGAHLENLVLGDLLAWSGTLAERAEILYWRTAVGDEVDFVVEWKGRLLAVEVKAADRVSRRDARGIMSFREEYGKAVHGGLLLHTGAEVFWLSEGILAAPWWRVI
jgi:predicted AAA+ superfamily ATPase